MQIISLSPKDELIMKKSHPCGGTRMEVVRVGSRVRVICSQCKRDMTIDRIKLEKSIKQVIHHDPLQQEKGTPAK